MARKNYPAVILLLLVFLGSCKGPEPVSPDPILPGQTGEILVACEGSLGNGNSALTRLPADSGLATEDVYARQNGQPLGDVFQSITIVGNQLALCINNSDKILFISRSDYRLQHTVSVPKPRYMLPVSSERAYVSSLFSNRVFVLNTTTYSITDTLFLGHKNPEGMLLHNGLAYIAAWDTANAFLYRVHPTQNRVIDSLALGRKAPHSMVVDKDKNIWIVSGNDAQNVRPALTKMDPANGQIRLQLDFQPGNDVLKPCLNGAGDTLYWLSVDYYGNAAQSGVFRMPISATSLPQTPFIAAGNLQYFWALGVHPSTGNIYVGDPKGFTQRGEVNLYSPAGSLLKRWPTGVGPGFFLFL